MDEKPLTVTEAGAIHQELGRLSGLVESQQLLTEEARDEARNTRKIMREELALARTETREELAKLPCRNAQPCPVLPKPPSGETRTASRTGSRYPAITKADIDAAVTRAEEAAEEAAERTVEERLEALEVQRIQTAKEAQEKRRDSIRWVLEIVKVLIPLLAGLGIAGSMKLECPNVAPAQMRSRDAAVPMAVQGPRR